MGELRILVCVKRVPAPGARILLTDDAMNIDTRNLGFTTSPHEECALEAAIQLAEQHGGSVTVLTLGAGDAEEQLRYAISVGAHQGVLVTNDAIAHGQDPDGLNTARAIAATIRELEDAAGTFDLVLFGNDSADSGGFQVGVRVARAFDRPIVNGIKGVEITDDSVVARRECAEGYEVYELDLPAMLGVKEGINLPRYATLPGRLKSKKALLVNFEQATDIDGRVTTVGFEIPTEDVTDTVMLGTGADAAAAVVDMMMELGVAPR